MGYTEKKLKILFFVGSMQGGGAERVASILCNEWVAMGHDVTLVVTYSQGGRIVYPLHQRVHVLFLADRVGRKKGIISVIKRVLEMRRISLQLKPDVSLSFITEINLANILANLFSGHEVIISERTFPPIQNRSWVIHVIRRILYRLSDKLVVQTTDSLEWAHSLFPSLETVAIPNPCNFPIPAEGKVVKPEEILNNNRKFILGCGRLAQEKRFDELLIAFSFIASDFVDIDLVLLGGGNLDSILKELTEELGIRTRVHFVGRVGNLDEWYRSAQLFALTSKYEGFPNALMEAVSYALPTVAYDIKTGPSELIQHQVNGLLVNVEDTTRGERIKRLADAISDILINQAFYRESAVKIAEKVRTDLEPLKVSKRWIEMFYEG